MLKEVKRGNVCQIFKEHEKVRKSSAHSHSHPLKQKVWYKPEMCPETNFRMIDLTFFHRFF